VFFIAVGVYLIQPFELQSPRQIVTFGNMIPDPCTTVAFTGHRTYCGEASAALAAAIRGLHAHGFRTFLCGMAVGIGINHVKNHEVRLNFRRFRPDWHSIKGIYQVGLPSIIMQSIGSVMTFGMNKILIAFTETAVSVFGVYFKLQSFVFMPVFGLTNGTVPIVAYNFGARKGDRMKKTIQYSVYAAIVIMICGALIFQSIPDKLLMLFDASDEMLRVGVPALRIISLSFPLAGFGIGAGAVFQALGFSVYSMIISLIRQLVVLIPCAYLIGMLTGDVTGVWWAFVVAEVVSLTVSALYLRRVNRDVIQTL